VWQAQHVAFATHQKHHHSTGICTLHLRVRVSVRSLPYYAVPVGKITSDTLKQILPGLIGSLYQDHSNRVVQSDTRKPSVN